MADTLSVRKILNLCQELWNLPTELTQLLTQFSTKLMLLMGHPILPLLRCLKKLLNLAFENPDKVPSWTPFFEQVSDDDYVTMCFPSDLVMKVFNYLQKCASEDITDNCSSSRITGNPPNGNTCTLSTIADGQREPVGALPSGDCLSNDDDELSGPVALDEIISEHSEYICSYTPENVSTISSPAPNGKFLVQLKLIPMVDAKKVPKEQLWTKLTKSAQFVATPLMVHRYQLLVELLSDVKKNILQNQHLKKTKRLRRFSPFSKNIRFAPY